MARPYPDCLTRLMDAGISASDAHDLRRIAMTLHRWHEMECGDSNDYCSSCVVRGRKDANGAFEYADDGDAYQEIHRHSENKAVYRKIPDRERGALKRLAAIMKRYPGFRAYVQGDPRGAALYLVGDVGADADLSTCYTRGIAIYK